MATSSSSSDSNQRRRKILERGTDRLALITGRISNLPPSLPSPSPSSSSSLVAHDHHQSAPPVLSDQINAGPASANNVSASTLMKQETRAAISGEETREAISGGNRIDTGHQVEPQPQQDETNREALQAPVSNYMTKTRTSSGTSILKQAEIDKNSIPKPRVQRPRFFSSRHLNSCIIASECIRSFCALMIALLVVLSYVDYALFGVNLVRAESILASRPLYIILVTDVTIVLALMYLQTRGSEEAEDERVRQSRDGQHLDGAIRLMERGLVVYQAIRGLFIDCSVYAVVVICGLSLV